jgi:hypothetical protein
LIKEFEVSAEHVAEKAMQLMRLKRSAASVKRDPVLTGHGVG